MKTNTTKRDISNFKRWDKATDYQSDESTVTIFDKNYRSLGTFSCFQFNAAKFSFYKKSYSGKNLLK